MKKSIPIMKNKIILSGEPRSTSHIYKTRVIKQFAAIYMSAEGKSLKESYQWQAKSQWKLPMLSTDLKLDVYLYFGTKRKCDIDNFNKLWADSLTGIVYNDDSQIVELNIKKFYCKEYPRIEIKVSTHEVKH